MRKILIFSVIVCMLVSCLTGCIKDVKIVKQNNSYVHEFINKI